MILTELEHASKHSNGAACVEESQEVGSDAGGERCWTTTESRVGVRRDRAADRASGRSAPGKRIRCNRPGLSSRARESSAQAGVTDSGYVQGYPDPLATGENVHPVRERLKEFKEICRGIREVSISVSY